MKSYKIVGVMVAMFAILVASAIPSYAWQPRTRLNVFRNTCGGSTKHTVGERIQARGGILSKILYSKASCGASVAGTPSCSGSMVASCGSSVASYVGSAPTPVYVSSPKGSAEFAAKLASEGRMYHDRSYIGYENVSSGTSSPEDAVRMWQNSPPHRRNLPFITDIQCVNGFCVGR